jgi:hypothetical protein
VPFFQGFTFFYFPLGSADPINNHFDCVDLNQLKNFKKMVKKYWILAPLKPPLPPPDGGIMGFFYLKHFGSPKTMYSNMGCATVVVVK